MSSDVLTLLEGFNGMGGQNGKSQPHTHRLQNQTNLV
jgi:hypothetical protein